MADPPAAQALSVFTLLSTVLILASDRRLGAGSTARPFRFTAMVIGGWSRSREIFGACGWATGGGYPVCGAAFGVRAGLWLGLDGGGLPVTPTGLWDLSPFYSLAPGPDL